MKKPLISVMIPTFNQSQYIKKTIDSVLRQTYKNIEIIISDDSTDLKTEQLVSKYYNNYHFIKYFHNIPSKGRTNNYRFILYHLVRGEWVINLDGDDYFDDNMFLEKCVEIINNHSDVLMVIGRQKILKVKENKFLYPYIIKKSDKEFYIEDGKKIFFDSILKSFEIPHLTTLYKKELAKQLNFYNGNNISSDRESLLKLSLLGRVAVLNRYAGVWVHHGANKSQNSSLDQVLENLKMYDRLYKFAINFDISKIKLLLWKSIAKHKMLFHFYLYKNKKAKKILLKKIFQYNKWHALLLVFDVRIYVKK